MHIPSDRVKKGGVSPTVRPSVCDITSGQVTQTVTQVQQKGDTHQAITTGPTSCYDLGPSQVTKTGDTHQAITTIDLTSSQNTVQCTQTMGHS